MARLIDADALKVQVMAEIRHYWNNGEGGYYLAEDVIPDIDNAPTVDAVPVVHGRWATSKRVAFSEECSVCGGCVPWDYYGCRHEYHFCPNCGAKMGGGKDDVV